MHVRTQADKPVDTDVIVDVTEVTHNNLTQHSKFERDRQRAVYLECIYEAARFSTPEDRKTKSLSIFI